jgi:hypothetical protein
MRLVSRTLLALVLVSAAGVFAAPPNLGTDVKVSPTPSGYLFEIVIKDLSTDTVVSSPRIVAQANQPAQLTTEREGGTIKTSVKTDGAFAEVRVEFLENGTVTSSSRLRLSVAAQ